MVRRCRPVRRWEAVADLAYGLIFLISPLVLAVGTDAGISPGLVVACIASVLAIGSRRGFPAVAVLLGLVVTWSSPTSGLVLLAGLSYAAGYRIHRLSRAVAVLVVVTILATVDATVGDLLLPGTTVLVVGAPGLLGRYRWQQRLLVMSGWERAERLRVEREMEVDRVRRQERSRIAYDMHDSLGHELSLIALQAGVLELDPELPGPQRELARTLRTSTTEAMDRLEDLVGVLRADVVDPEPVSVQGLIERAIAAGMVVRLEKLGEERPLAVMADKALYRVVQESLTNAAKHAPGESVLVRIEQLDDEVVVTVSNKSSEKPAVESGLVGLAERVRLVGGQLTAGPYDGDFLLTARIPRDFTEPGPAPEPVSVVRRLRFDFWTKLVVPVVAVALALTVLDGAAAYVRTNASAMYPDAFAGLRIGSSETEISLPSSTVDTRGSCRFYGRRDTPFGTAAGRYRLCFANGRLVSKDIVT